MTRRTAQGRSRGRVALAALTSVLLLALAACASIPDSGPVRQGGPVAEVNDQLDLDFNPSPPEKGATPQRIVQGFIDAASSPKNNFAIAREYLTTPTAASWNPDESVTVDDGRNRTFDHTGNQWSVDVTPVANVDAVGAYHPVSSTSPVGLRYELAKEDGEWRIAVAPDGVVIDDPTFRAVYAQQTLYFYSPDFTYLVPDARWFPARVATAATRVASAVLAGPVKWLTGAVTSAFPKGTELAVPSVTTTGGVARVDLSAEAAQADSLQLQRMQLQLERSLGTLAPSVQLSIEGNQEQISPPSGNDVPIQSPSVDSHAIVYRGDEFGLVSGSGVSPLSGLSDKVVALQPTAVALTPSRDQAAVLSRGAAYLVRRSGDPVRVDARAGLVAPAIDTEGFVWTVPSTTPGALQVAGANGEPHAVKTDWGGATGIQAVAVSRDGTRLVALLTTPSGPSLVAAGIVRGSGGLPTQLTEPVELAVGAGTPRSVAWTGELTVAVLSTTSGDATSILEQTIGGAQTATTGPGGGRTIVGAGGLSRYLVLTAEGSLQAPTGTGWQQQADKVGAVAVQLGQP
ncbi:LpqB family beta-propeller domain-containing protein [Leifsonia sp. F6_8S_P_1B]|uniref:Lipoprotein LpqB n=1 Tax=Leifsonia williamsii TaxID=3035919 RepID=A0ABT8KBV1_9MICO|nr:GerMN domain-containing protein [Leifsonia williamsii]MDN4614458.1 LpqB family beta-propeller domain-containing protein [Leifsonia williamsii]